MLKEYNNSLEIILPTLEDNSVNMIFADFPFGTTQCKWDSLVDLDIFWKNAWRILKKNGVVICKAQFPFTATLAMSQMKYLRYDWVWEKTSATGHLNAKKMPMKAHENFLVFYKKLPTYNPQMTQGHERKVSSAKNRADCINRKNEKEDYIYGKEFADKVSDYDSTERYPRSVLKISSDKQKTSLHPTQTPLDIFRYFIKTYSNEGDVILDPCRGVNGCGIVCDELGRGYTGIERDEYFFKLGLLRRKFPEKSDKELLIMMTVKLETTVR